MKPGKTLLGLACCALLWGTAYSQLPTPAAARGAPKDATREPPQSRDRQVSPGAVSAPMNMRIRGDGLALPQGVGRDADDQRDEQREAPKPAPEEAKKPER